MGFHTLLIMLMFGYIPYKTKTLPIDCGKPVQKCPVEKKEWKLKNDEMKCARNEGYVCMADYKGYLLESCMLNFTIQAHSANCPVILACNRNRPFLGTVGTYIPCPDELHGCPPTNHEEYSIYQLYKYPNCIRSNAPSEEEINSTRKNKTLLNSTIKPDEQKSKSITLSVILSLVLTVFLLVLEVSVVSIVYFKRKDGTVPFSSYFSKENTETEPLTAATPNEVEQLRGLVRSCNELEVDKAQILSFDLVNIDQIFTQVIIHDETEKYVKRSCDIEAITKCAQDELFNISKDKQARFIFMLGEAGYGKTVECLRITKLWCKAWQDYGSFINFVGNLKEFDLLFLVKMRDANNRHTSLIDMILDAYSRFQLQKKRLDDIREILEKGICKSIILLDGLDEWGLPEDERKHIWEKAIPNFANIQNSTILITMRSSKFMEVKNICRHRETRVLRLLGLDKNGIMNVTASMVSRSKKINKCSNTFEETYKSIWGVDSKSSCRENSFEKVPLLAVFRILSHCEKVENGNSQTQTSLYLSFLETLIKKAQTGKREQENQGNLNPHLKDYPHLRMNVHALMQLGKIALSSLSSQRDSLILSKQQLNEMLGTDEYDIVLKIGFIAPDPLPNASIKLQFFHETVQEFLASLFLWTQENEDHVLKYFLQNEVTNIEKVFKFSMVLTFLSGLSPEYGCKISELIAKLAGEDDDICKFREYFSSESYEKVSFLYDLQLRCYREVRGDQSIGNFIEESPFKFMFSDVILHGKDTDEFVIRETADILLYHADDIQSLQMKFIPNDKQNGITNDELQRFLEETTPLKSLNIDGYVGRQCRLFHSFSSKMQGLHTLGLHNIAFTGTTLTDLLTKDETKRSIKALGLFDIRSDDDIDIDYEYDFLSCRFGGRSGNEPKQRVPPRSNTLHIKDDFVHEIDERKPVLCNIINALPGFHNISILHFSYMDSFKDRKMMLEMLPRIRTLEHVGYHGSPGYRRCGERYDDDVIAVIMNMEQLRIIFLSDITLNEETLTFEKMFILEEIKLQNFEISSNHWENIVRSIHNLKNPKYLKRIVLTDTNISTENINALKQSSDTLEITTYQSSAW